MTLTELDEYFNSFLKKENFSRGAGRRRRRSHESRA